MTRSTVTRPTRRAIPRVARVLIALTVLASLAMPATTLAQGRVLDGRGTASPVASTVPRIRFVSLKNSSGVAHSFDQPVFVTHATRTDRRLFVVEQAGRIRIRYPNGSVSTFLDIRDRVLDGGERGLLSLAFHPGYATNYTFYVYYTDGQGDIVVAEYRASSGTDNTANRTERRLLDIPHRSYSNHNGGSLAFRGDHLYISTGDGGGAHDPLESGQNKDSLLGKVLRIRPNPGRTPSYTIPSDNPFYGAVAGDGRIWAYGLRNPWRMSFDRTTGDLWVADVGQNRYEEVNRATAASGGGRGRNYGWDVMEGSYCHEPLSGCDRTGKTLPVTQYSHADGSCSVTGGYVYRGGQSGLQGRYLFGDYCSGKVWSYTSSLGRQLLLDTAQYITSFGEDYRGEIHVATSSGRVYWIDAY